jgi:hypothetical protein
LNPTVSFPALPSCFPNLFPSLFGTALAGAQLSARFRV